MPDLNTSLHLEMLRDSPILKQGTGLYGLEWGDPETLEYLNVVKRNYLSFFIDEKTHVVEIGPGGGRWTRYMVGAEKIYAVDYHQELLEELRKNFDLPNIKFIKNQGNDFPGIPDASIEFIFSFGVFVHLDFDIIESYIQNMRRILKPNGCAVIQYSDKTKPIAQRNRMFSENTPDRMLALIRDLEYRVEDDNRWLLPHSSIVRFRL